MRPAAQLAGFFVDGLDGHGRRPPDRRGLRRTCQNFHAPCYRKLFRPQRSSWRAVPLHAPPDVGSLRRRAALPRQAPRAGLHPKPVGRRHSGGLRPRRTAESTRGAVHDSPADQNHLDGVARPPHVLGASPRRRVEHRSDARPRRLGTRPPHHRVTLSASSSKSGYTTTGMARSAPCPIPFRKAEPGQGRPNGVMNNPLGAIRDQVFWRWHKLDRRPGREVAVHAGPARTSPTGPRF